MPFYQPPEDLMKQLPSDMSQAEAVELWSRGIYDCKVGNDYRELSDPNWQYCYQLGWDQELNRRLMREELGMSPEPDTMDVFGSEADQNPDAKPEEKLTRASRVKGAIFKVYTALDDPYVWHVAQTGLLAYIALLLWLRDQRS